MGHHFGSGSNPAQTGVGYKEITKRALQDHDPDALIDFEFPPEFVEFLRQNFVKKIYRRVIDADECDSRIKPEPETFVIRILQESGSISA
jgi:phospholipid N-methyltransferase